MSPSKSIVISHADTSTLTPHSVTPSWILAGKPENSAKQLTRSRDRTSYTMVWDCTAGRFNWYYPEDETLVVLSGEAFISSDRFDETRIGPGDVVYFPAGCSATWRVTDYIQKVAFLRQPVPPPFGFGVRAWNKLLRILRLRPGGGL